MLLCAYWPGHLAERPAKVDDVLFFGRYPHHYSYRRWPDGHWGLVLRHPDGHTLAVSPQRHASETACCHAAHALADWVRQLACQCAPTGAHLQLLPEQDAPPPGASLRQHYLTELNCLMARFDPYPERRNRFLNYLLARFNEHFDDALLHSFDPRPANTDGFLLELASWKAALVVQLPAVERPTRPWPQLYPAAGPAAAGAAPGWSSCWQHGWGWAVRSHCNATRARARR